MKRDEALQDLSRDHFTVLNHVVDALRIRAGSEHAKPLPEVWASWQALWPTLESHFEEEEELILPILDTETWGEPLAFRLRAEHGRIRDDGRALAGDPEATVLWNLAESVRIHVRWEEDTLFPALQDKLGNEQLSWLGEKDRAYREERGLPAGPARP